MFLEAVRTAGDVAGVFEYDGATAYFYLYEMTGQGGHRVMAAIHVLSGEADFGEADVAIRWNRPEDKVGLFIRNQIWALFDGGARHGGGYTPDQQPALPSAEALGFGSPL